MSSDKFVAAVRAYAIPTGSQEKGPGRGWKTNWEPRLTIIIDCEPDPDRMESLSFGYWRVLDRGRLVDEGYFYAEDLRDEAINCLQQVSGQVAEKEISNPRVLDRAEFLRTVFYPVAYKRKGRVVGHDLPYIFSRIAKRWTIARKPPYKDGFSFVLLQFTDDHCELRDDARYPRIGVKFIDSRISFIGFTSAWKKRADVRVGNHDSKPRAYRGRFVDTRTLTCALTGELYSLADACRSFGIGAEEFRSEAKNLTVPEEAEQLRKRIRITQQLYERLHSEYKLHDLSLPIENCLSVASIGKAHFRDMGISIPRLEVPSNLGFAVEQILGWVMTSFYGGRTEVHLRKILAPVIYCDFKSMYPTINVLMGLWKYLTADKIVVEDATAKTRTFVENVTSELSFTPDIWQNLTILVEVQPDQDIFPIRTKFSQAKNAGFTIGLNSVSSPMPMWFTLADVIVSVLKTGKVPKILRAIQFRPVGTQSDMQPVSLRGSIPIDPSKDDYFKKIVEARRSAETSDDISSEESARLSSFLKTLDNVVCYGIFIQLLREVGAKTDVDVYGLETFSCTVDNPEEPGEFFFPILATLITGAARLMLALVEIEVERMGGTYAFMDTDSIAIVASEEGGIIPCQGGKETTDEGHEAIRALTWDQVESIRSKFEPLNRFNKQLVPGSILDLEDENFAQVGGGGKERKQLWCYALASKKYALFNMDNGDIILRKFSKHGLGNYIAPIDHSTQEPVPNWIDVAWKQILRPFFPSVIRDEPDWFDQIVMTKFRVSTPKMMEWFTKFNYGKSDYQEMMKPFNSFNHAPLDTLLGRSSNRSSRICLISPTHSPQGWPRRWVNTHAPDGPQVRVIPPRHGSFGTGTCIGITYRDLIESHSHTPEPKSLGPSGEPCGRKTRGLLGRRHITITDIVHIGKEANEIDRVQAGLVGSEDKVLLTYERDLWDLIQPILKEIPVAQVMEITGYSRSMVYRLKRGEKRPASDRLEILLEIVAEHSRNKLVELGYKNAFVSDRMAVVEYIRFTQRNV